MHSCMTSDSEQSIWQRTGLRETPVRKLILRTLEEAKAPLSGQQIEDILESVDRSSITRTLALFAERAIVHSLEDGTGSVKYEICRDEGHDTTHLHTDRHPHFHCKKCGATICLESLMISADTTLPEGYEIHDATLLYTGLCPICAAKK